MLGCGVVEPLLFPDIGLARRIEQSECQHMLGSAAAIAAHRAQGEVETLPVAGGVAVFTGRDSPITKIVGLGFAALDLHELDAAERMLAARGSHVQVELSTLADPAVGTTLSERGYRLRGFEDVLGQTLPSSFDPVLADDVTLAVVPDDGLEAWADTCVGGFLTPDTEGVPSHEIFPREPLRRIMLELADGPEVTRYLARRGGVLAGAGSFSAHQGIAHFTGASTIPEHRRSGVQTALVARRLKDAATAGCDLAVVVTQPGSKSQHNAMRQGFSRLYSRAMLVR